MSPTTLELQKNSNFEEDEQSDFSQVPSLRRNIIGTTFLSMRHKKNFTDDQERNTRATLEDGVANIGLELNWRSLLNDCEEVPMTSALSDHGMEKPRTLEDCLTIMSEH